MLSLVSSACASIPPGRAAIDSVDVVGNSALSSSDIEEKLAIASSPKFLALFSGVVFDYEIFDRFVLQRDLDRVERFYQARGFYEAHARAARVVYTERSHVAVTIEVEEGAPVNTGPIDLSGAEQLPSDVRKALRSAVFRKLQEGVRFDEDDFDAAEIAAKRVLTDRGYAYARVKRFAAVDLPSHVARVGFGIVPGPPARLGKITIVGLGSLPEAPVRRALNLTEGEVYSTRALDDAQQSLLDLGVFGSVGIASDLPDPPPESHVVAITVNVEPSRLRSVRLGGGVELDTIKTDIHLRAGWEDRNFLGGLRRFTVDVRPGVVLYPTRLPDLQAPTKPLPEERLRITLNQPGFFEPRASGIVRAEFNIYPVLLVPDVHANDPVLGYREFRGSAGVDRIFWKLFASLTYNAQVNFPFTYVGPFDPSLQKSVISYVDFLTNLDFRDDRVHPHSGIYLGNDLQFAGGVLGGDAQDIRIQPEVRVYVPLAKRVTLAGRTSVGALFPLNYGDTLNTNTSMGQVPPGVDKAAWARDIQLVYFRSFFAGGSTSDRGWPLRGIGPHGIAPFFSPGLAARQIAQECAPGQAGYDSTRCAVPLGGLSLWEASAELRFPVLSALEGATFCDAADVSPGRANFRLDRPHLSCGLGLRYETPVGPIRLDIAYRIPGLQTLGGIAPGDDGEPGTIFGVPIAFALGIGEAF